MSHDGNVRACYLPHASLTSPDGVEAVLDRCARLGFSSVVLPCPFAPDGQWDSARLSDPARLAPAFEWSGPAVEGLGRLAALAANRGLQVFMDVRLDEVDPGSPLLQRHPAWFRPHHASEGPLPDPRQPPPAVSAVVRWRSQPHDIGAWWQQQLEEWCEAGVAGFRCLWPQRVPADAWSSLIRGVKSRQAARFWAWTPGLEPAQAAGLAGCGFDAGCSSLAWWDFRSPWFFDEDLRLREFPSVIAVLDDPRRLDHGERDEIAVRERLRLLRLAAALGDGVLARFDPRPDPRIDAATVEMNLAVAARQERARKGLRPVLGGSREPVIGCLLEAPDGSSARLVLANADSGHVGCADMAPLLRTLGDWRPVPSGGGAGPDDDTAGLALEPAEVREMALARPEPVRIASRARLAADKAAAMPRIAIEGIVPAIDAGRFPIKRIIGEPVRVQADVFCDGHDLVTAALLWRPLGQRQWQSAPMRNMGNDRWAGEFTPARVGRHEYVVEAWRDEFATARMDLEKRLAADTLSALDLDEVCLLVSNAASESGDAGLRTIQQRLQDTEALPARAAILLEPGTASAMARAGGRPFLARSQATYLVDCERQAAGFSSWYELFPRSQSPAPEPGQEQRHGTFDDVIGRLPAIRQMGFDVLYMPPIHPIGRINRKGRNNSVTADPGEPGSPYAIGASEGGHDAIHPELGTLEDFRKLVAAAAGEGLELALDFAIQCSPDHPWLREHPDWFAWRADGSIRYAENPPKRYEDIVNVDFYAKGAVPGLWTTLRDVVAFWVNEGVRLFRVDNPHTKPFPFWEWMIAEIHATHPDVVFLSEAFTRPRLMYRLAKVGYSQSYTYFTWRNSKAELTEYMTELADGEPSEFFRPHFFVNTPDINPVFLQTSGRPGHLIRAALATTLAGLWGMYSGFELCDATPLKPGKEEYLDSEKYQLRHWNWRREGDIVDEITRLNQLRRLNPALQTHLGIRFYNAFNDNILYFGKRRGEREDMILVAINLDPHNAQEADFELPLWEWGLPDHGSLVVEDLWRGTRSVRQGKHQHLRLDPAELPFAIWRVGPPEGAHA